MSLRIISAFAAVLLLAACESAPSDTGMASGAGGASSGGSSSQAAGPRPGSQEDLVVNVGDRVFFDFDQFSVRQDQRAVLDVLSNDGSFVDEIAAAARMSVSEALSSLTMLELKGLVRQFSGKRFAPR